MASLPLKAEFVFINVGPSCAKHVVGNVRGVGSGVGYEVSEPLSKI